MNEQVQKIVVVGGGTAGWLSAAYLRRALPDSVSITLVESERIGRIGVGEATIPTLGATMAFLGYPEDEWMPAVGATYKAAIRFVGWGRPHADGTPHSYWHPFIARPEPTVLPYEAPFFPELGRGFSLLHYALKRRLEGSSQSIAEMMLPTPALCEAKRSPRHPDSSRDLVTAYHIDATTFASFLCERTVERGVHHVLDDVVSVDMAGDERIRAVRTASGRELEADLFIDCTGFRGALIRGALGAEFQSDADRLLVDRAVAFAKPNAEGEGLEPYTTATALKHGWTGHIPLMHRTGCGYVYSSAHTTPEEAEAELREHLDLPDAEARHLRFRVGRADRMWIGNCVAIGLSASFLEPLESTGIFLAEFGLATLVSLFPDQRCDPALSQRFNDVMADMYDEARDFVLLHYLVSDRDDTAFWRDARAVPRTSTLDHKLSLYQARLPVLDELKLTLFRSFNYTCILDGCGALPDVPHPMLEHTGYDAGYAALDAIAADTAVRLEDMPDNHTWLSEMYTRSTV